MEFQAHLQNMRSFQASLIEFINNDASSEEDYQNLVELLEELRCQSDQCDIKEMLHLLLNSANNHYRNSHFFEKIERILTIFEDQITKKISKRDIFNIFKKNKRILLFLFEQKILIPDEHIARIITKKKYVQEFYPQYFFPEFQKFFSDTFRQQISESIKRHVGDQIKRYFENRMIGENDDYISYLIRNDLISQFITYVNKNNLSLSTIIKSSIYETNSLLLKNNNNITLIEYAAFFGSIQIFRYLYLNSAPLSQFLWTFGVHSQNPELINLLEDYKIVPRGNSFKECLYESIKCHHVEMSNYLLENFFNNQIDNELFLTSLKYHNYIYFPNELSQISQFAFSLCKYDYPSIVKLLLQTTNLNLDAQIVSIKFFNKIKFEFL